MTCSFRFLFLHPLALAFLTMWDVNDTHADILLSSKYQEESSQLGWKSRKVKQLNCLRILEYAFALNFITSRVLYEENEFCLV